MNRETKYLKLLVSLIILGRTFIPGDFKVGKIEAASFTRVYEPPPDTTAGDTTRLRYPLKEKNYPVPSTESESPLLLKNPSNIKSSVIFDPLTRRYIFSQKVGDIDYRLPSSMSIKEYRKFQNDEALKEYWYKKSKESTGGKGPSFMKSLHLGSEALDKVFGTDAINITPQGSAELIFGYNISKIDNPQLSVRNRKNGSFTFKEKIQMNVTGSIGDKMQLGINYNTEATFDFDNKTKLEYTGKEDDIIKKIQAGNVNFPLPGSLITGSQSLFGLKTELQFGKLTMTNVFSHQRGESSSIQVQGGAQQTDFSVNVDQYDANRNFFLSQFFKDHYNSWLKNLPYIESGVRIEQIEVWVTNKTSDFENARNIVAFMDLGESYNPDNEPNFYGDNSLIHAIQGVLPADNQSNSLYNKMAGTQGIRNINSVTGALQPLNDMYSFKSGQDYEKVENARKLSNREFTVNRQLGYISLNSALRNDEVLAVAYVYTYKGKTYKVGELSTDGYSAPSTLILKLIKGTNLTPKYPNWQLMMKNIYSIGAYQVSNKNFILNVFYRNDQTGAPVNYINEGAIKDSALLQVLNLDNLDSHNEPNPDGMFDFVEGTTILAASGRIIFPVLEPFGRDLRKAIVGNNPSNNAIADKYVYQELYDSTQTKAQQIAEKNKFFLAGSYQSSSSSEIQLNAMNIPQGSVKVTAGGIQLTENIDYTVDYTLGRVKILNQGLMESGTPLNISLESNSLFNIQTKTLVGTHLDYRFSDNFNIGGTVMNLTERPLTQKVNMGEEPISNTIWGLNTSYRTKSQLLTNLIDKLPFLETKEPSSIALDAEFAQLIPGQAKAIGKNGVAYIDDFEGAQTKIDMKSMPAWVLASTPENNPMFPEGNLNNNLEYGYNRAKLAWYVIDPLFTRNRSQTPSNITADMQSSNYVREISEQEVFPNRQSETTFNNTLSVLNLAFYPNERGPYNYDVDGVPGISKGVNNKDQLNDPASRWGGMMREIQTSDFETSNVEYIEFWLMDPFVEDTLNPGGDLYFNLGEVSEDILRDSRKAFENGLPTSDSIYGVDTTAWGLVPRSQSYVTAFDNDPTARKYQDVGFDGLTDNNEKSFFKTYLEKLKAKVDPAIYEQMLKDPSSDDFHYFLGAKYDSANLDILERYKDYNGVDGNSPTSSQSEGDFAAANKTSPDVEDINRDNTLNQTETYFQYHVSMRPEDMVVGKNFITDEQKSPPITFKNGKTSEVTWYQFRIPISEYENKVGPIEDFKSIRFMRLFLTHFQKPVIMRFATMDLVRGEWREYKLGLSDGGPSLTDQNSSGSFDISAVNIEENGNKTPVNYLLPPGIDRVIDPSNPQLRQLNEQSLLLKVGDLPDNDARTVYKNVQLDLRQYKRLKMFIHAEAIPGKVLNDNDITAFIRIGSDYKDNFYEYEVPLAVTPPAHYDDNDANKLIIWPDKNTIDLLLDKLVEIKKERNQAIESDPVNYSITKIFRQSDGNNIIKVKGNPNLSNIREIMIGIRNPGDGNNTNPNDGLPKSAEVWVNELRLTDFNNKGGWAANARLQARLADFGTLSIAGSTSQPGFGGVEQKVEERPKEQTIQYDISSNFELGKFFPEKAAVSIPMYVGLSRSIINPQYYPKDPDVLLKDVLKNAKTKEEKKKIKKESQDYTERKSINFTNVRWNKEIKKFKPVSPGNLSATAAFSEVSSRNYTTEYNNIIKYNLGLNYVFNTRPKSITPFRKSKLFKSPALRLIRDFNFTPYPSRFTFSTFMDRNYSEVKMKNVFSDYQIKIDSTVSKDFTWNRNYAMNWDLTRSLKLTYTASNIARIDEPNGAYDLFKPNNQRWKDSVMTNILNGGRNTNFNQSFDLNYTLPINKIPIFNWITMSARYNSNYSWEIGPILKDPTRRNDLGNNLKNSNTIQFTNQFNMNSLYNKIGFVKRIYSKYSGGNKKESEKRYKTVTYTKPRVYLKKDVPRNIIHKLGTEDVTVKIFDSEGKEIQGKVDIINENKLTVTMDSTYAGATINIEGKVEKGENPLVFVMDNTVRLLTGFKNFSATYRQNGGTFLRGYMPGTKYFGLNSSFNAPGVPFILGWQDRDFVHRAGNVYDWLTKDPTFSNPYTMTNSKDFNFRGTYEPFRGFRIDFTAMRQYSEGFSEYFVHDSVVNYYSFENGITNGNFSMSFISLGTAFEKSSAKNGWKSATFDKFKEYRKIISGRLHKQKVDNSGIGYNTSITQDIVPGYTYGYGPTSSEVLIPAFMAAYGNFNPQRITLKAFPWMMLPNWRVSIDGLSQIEMLKRVFQSVNISHSYRSTYNVGNFTTSLDYEANSKDGISYIRDLQNNFIPKYQINAVSINEEINPLIGVDITWINNLITRFEINKSRLLALSLTNNQLTETRNNELVIGTGYRFKDVPIIINQRSFKSDLNLRFDLSIRDNVTVIRSITPLSLDEINQSTGGQKVFKVNFTADYNLTERFSIQFFFDRTVNTPYTSRSFLTADTNVGFSVRFSL